jgi:DNA (cytosine-5)-methyltransferase 1
MTYTFIDLFAGIGGIRIGFEKAGCRCVWSNEHDRKAAETYTANFGGADLVVEDIRKVSTYDIPDFDILCAGFPCQPFSIAGVSKKNSLGRPHGFEDETQGTLFHDIVRILKDKQPQAFFLENVKNIENHDKGNTFRVIQGAIEELGYSFQYRIINAKTLVPQNRERIFMVGFRDRSIALDFPEIPNLNPKFKDILERNVDPKYTLSDRLWRYLQNYAKKHRAKGNGFGFGIANPEGHCRTLSARYYKDGSEILIAQKGRNPRRLTPRECARLQGFDNSFKIPVSDTAAYKQFGNAVVVPLIGILAKSLVRSLDAGSKKAVSVPVTRIRS